MHFEIQKPRLYACLTVTMIVSACSFPTVVYEETAASCAVPMSCVNDVAACSNKAQATQNMCAMKCSMSCVECESDFDRDLGICVAQCETCSANGGCANATESCKAMLGVP
jgi:hypothetical protein